MTIENNILTDETAANGFGGIDAERYERALEQIDLTFDFQNRPALDDVFTSEFLPPQEERQLN